MRFLWLHGCLLAGVAALHAQESLGLNSDANATDLTSGGAVMDVGLRFELGSFEADFGPGKPACVWGFRGSPASCGWPDAGGFMFHEWFAKDATPFGGAHPRRSLRLRAVLP